MTLNDDDDNDNNEENFHQDNFKDDNKDNHKDTHEKNHKDKKYLFDLFGITLTIGTPWEGSGFLYAGWWYLFS